MKAIDNNGTEYNVLQKENEFIVKKSDISLKVEYVDLIFDEFDAVQGENGYYVIADVNNSGSYICEFTEKKDSELIIKQNLMPIFGVKNKNCCILGIVTGMRYNFNIVTGKKGKDYYLFLRFKLDDFCTDEDIKTLIVKLDKNSGYSEMAQKYREYQLNNNKCVPLKERIKKRPLLEYAVESPEIRIRMGWKPVPPEILEQTEENEPEMHVACTFERVKDIVDELARQGVDKAQLCLVGWNKSGHDGRWPQMFPVEEKLGGEKKLRELISCAQKKGYQIVCHTNSTDCYSIADSFTDEVPAKEKNGGFKKSELPWSGGRMYRLCPKKAYEYACEDLPKVAELGFEGLHYVDVLSVIPPIECHEEKHKSNGKNALEYYNGIMEMCHKYIGGFSSEGTYDFTAKYLDYGLYTLFENKKNDFFERRIPLWQLVYHGIILSNPTTDTVNYTIKPYSKKLLFKEYGGRPSFYFYSKFISGILADWLGKEDLICDTDEQLRYSVSKIKEAYDEYKEICHLQYEFMVKHEEVKSRVYKCTYSDGTGIIVDYNTGL